MTATCAFPGATSARADSTAISKSWTDSEQKIPSLYDLSVREVDAHQFTGHTRADLYPPHRLELTGILIPLSNVLQNRICDRNLWWRTLRVQYEECHVISLLVVLSGFLRCEIAWRRADRGAPRSLHMPRAA